MRPSGVRRPLLADPLPMTLRVYRKLSHAMVPLSPALISRRLINAGASGTIADDSLR